MVYDLSMLSRRFNKPIIFTRHAIQQMMERMIDGKTLYDLIENDGSSKIKYKNPQHLWIYKSYSDRDGNMLCAAVIERNNLIVKTVMIHWKPNNEH